MFTYEEKLNHKLLELKQQNPFHGMTALRRLSMSGKSASSEKDLYLLLNNAYKEALTLSKSGKETMFIENFFSYLIKIGDITNRKHRMFGNRKDINNGGHAARKQWRWAAIWLLENNEEVFILLMPTLIKMIGISWMFEADVITEKSTAKIKEIRNFAERLLNRPAVLEAFLQLLRNDWIAANPMDRTAIAKYFSPARLTERSRIKKGQKVSRKLQPVTYKMMKVKDALLRKWCSIMDFEIDESRGFTYFKGWINARRPYVKYSEYSLFSTKEILNFDKEGFIAWLNGKVGNTHIAKPNDHAVRLRLLNKDNTPKTSITKVKGVIIKGKPKWDTPEKPLSEWFLEYEKRKDAAQKEKRELDNKIAQGTATQDDMNRYVKVEKIAKVKQQAFNIGELFDKIACDIYNKNGQYNTAFDTGTVNRNAQMILDNMKNEVPVLVIVDTSISMNDFNGNAGAKSIDKAAIAATIMMLKNPSSCWDMLIRFDNVAGMYCGSIPNTVTIAGANRFMVSKNSNVTLKVDRTKTFLENYTHIRSLLSTQGSTSPNCIFSAFKRWYDSSSTDSEKTIKREAICAYQTLFIISDGHFNDHVSEKFSIQALQKSMLDTFGWKGLIVIWDICGNSKDANNFQGLENVIHMSGGDPNKVNEVVSKLSDCDIIDQFTELRTMYQSNRYEHIRNLIKTHYAAIVQ